MTDHQITFDLKHYGVKGQKWGVRRGRTVNTSGHGKIDPATLSNPQYAKMVRRMQLDKSYNDITTAPKPRTEGKAYAHSLLKSAGTTIVTAALGAAVSFAVQKQLKARVGVDVKVPKTVPSNTSLRIAGL